MPLQPNPFHLVLREPFLRTVVKFSGARAFMRGHLLRVLKGAAVGEIGGDSGRPKRVAADLLSDAGRRGRLRIIRHASG
jgi:hypothetical protein